MPRTRLSNVDAIILRRSDYGEADRLLTVFSANQGKVRLLAKGARKTKSRKAGHIELFMHTILQVAEGRNFGIVTQADTVESFRPLHEDLDKISQGYYLSELVDKFTEEHDPNFNIFELLALTLARISDGEVGTRFLALRYFELHLLSLTGYQPQLHFCITCSEAIQAEDNYFAVPSGGVLCPNCGETVAQARRISLGALKVLRFLQTHPWPEAANLQLTPTTQDIVERILLDYISYVLERQLKSVDFLKKLKQITD
jgi:DNA repair protein RecO (recombination protein O)